MLFVIHFGNQFSELLKLSDKFSAHDLKNIVNLPSDWSGSLQGRQGLAENGHLSSRHNGFLGQ